MPQARSLRYGPQRFQWVVRVRDSSSRRASAVMVIHPFDAADHPRFRPGRNPGIAKPAAPRDIQGANGGSCHVQTGERRQLGLQLLVAGILLQTLFFKFTAAPESVYIFTRVGAEPWGRIASGVVELVAAVLLLTPALVPLGAILTVGVMAGAILSHLTILGIEVQGDGGLLFALALTAFTGSLVVLAIRRTQIPVVGRYWSVAA